MTTRTLATFCVGLMLLVVGPGCSENGGPDHVGESGNITASAQHITGQVTKVYAVAVFDYDWQPGATGLPIGTRSGSITSDDFSFEVSVFDVDGYGQPTMTERVFAPATYSVVFFVSTIGVPPEYFVEVFADVDGDITVQAPAWGTWTHAPSPE